MRGDRHSLKKAVPLCQRALARLIPVAEETGLIVPASVRDGAGATLYGKVACPEGCPIPVSHPVESVGLLKPFLRSKGNIAEDL